MYLRDRGDLKFHFEMGELWGLIKENHSELRQMEMR